MAYRNKVSPWRFVRYFAVILAAIVFFVMFIIWRTDNPRIEAMRFAVMDRYTPNLDTWLYTPISRISGVLGNFQSYDQLTRENRELRLQLRQMESWREAALQLEQINAELRALNNLSVRPNMSFVTGEVIADSGTPFSQTALVNIGKNKGVQVGAPAVDSVGVIGRVIGVGQDKARILLLSDPTSQVSAHIMPERIRAIVTGNNGRYLEVQTFEGGSSTLAGSRVVTSGDGVYPEGLTIGYVVLGEQGMTVRLAANYSSLELARILLPSAEPEIPANNEFIGEIPEEERGETTENGEGDDANVDAEDGVEATETQ